MEGVHQQIFFTVPAALTRRARQEHGVAGRRQIKRLGPGRVRPKGPARGVARGRQRQGWLQIHSTAATTTRWSRSRPLPRHSRSRRWQSLHAGAKRLDILRVFQCGPYARGHIFSLDPSIRDLLASIALLTGGKLYRSN
jgi:hypothetical protein